MHIWHVTDPYIDDTLKEEASRMEIQVRQLHVVLDIFTFLKILMKNNNRKFKHLEIFLLSI